MVALALFLSFAAVAATAYEAYTFLHGDGAFYANINKSLAHDLSLDQGKYHPRSWLEEDLGWNKTIDQGWSNVSLGADGQWLPKHSFVMPLFSTPLYVLFGLNGLLLFQLLMMTVGMFAAYKVAVSLLPRPAALAAVLVLAAQPIVAGDIYSYNNDAFYTALLMCGAWAFVVQRWGISGLFFGLAVWAKITNLLFVAPFAVAVLWRRDLRLIARAVIPFLVPLILFAASNWVLFGAPTTTSYHVVLVRHDGLLQTESISKRFEEPFTPGLKRILTDDFQGLNHKAPLLWLTLPGILALLAYRRTRPAALAYAAVLGAFVVLHTRYDFTYARFFLPVAMLGAVPIGGLFHMLGDPKRPRVTLLIGAGIAVALLGWGLVSAPSSGDGYRLSDHVEDAVVMQGKVPCDYFNNARQKFECMSDSGRGHTFFWGRALGDDQCVFDEEPRRMLFLHPPVGREKSRHITFPAVPAGKKLVITYGLADSSQHDDIRFRITVNGTAIKLPAIEKRGELVTHTVEPSPLTEEKNTVEIKVRTPPAHWRHLCVEAVVTD